MTENPETNGQASPELAELQSEMRKLRGRSGLSLRALSKRAHFSPTALNRAEKLPKRPTWEVVEGYVTGCDGPVDKFRRMWEAAGATAVDDPLKPGDDDPDHDPYSPPQASGLRQLLALVSFITVLVVALVTAAFLFPPGNSSCQAPATLRSTAPGLIQCVGLVSDPTNIPIEFGMSPVLAGIAAQNAQIGAEPTVTLAYVLPLPTTPSSFSTQLRNELDGVRLAQERANQRSGVGGDLPKIRIAVYNTGQDNAVQSDVLAAIDATNSDIVAVLGLGQSRQNTIELVNDLISRLIAIFPARATADTLVTGPAGLGLFRVTPLNKNLAAAAVSQLPEETRVALLEDKNTDPYSTGLAQDFRDSLKRDRPDGQLLPLPQYDSSLNATGTAFNNEIIPSLCQAEPDSVFIAGRGRDIEKFLIALNSDTQCQNRKQPLTVLTGDDGVDVLNQVRRAIDGLADPGYAEDSLNVELREAFRNNRFVFRYTALTHPDLWSTPEFRGSREFNDALRSFDPQRNPNSRDLEEGSSMMGYDTAVAAIRCVRRAATQSDVVAQPSKVIGACYSFTPGNPIFGVGGRIAFDSSGLVVGRTIPVVEVTPDGGAPVRGVAAPR